MNSAPEPSQEAAQPRRRLRRVLGWLPAGPAVVAVIGAVLPWFAPTGSGQGGGLSIAAAYCWQAGRIGFLAPVIIVLTAVTVVGARQGWFGKDRPHTLGRDAIVLSASGLGAGAIVALTWFLLPNSYSFPAGLTWDSLTGLGYRITRNPQPGYFLTIAAAAAAIGCGIGYLMVARREPSDSSSVTAGKIDNHDGEDPERHDDPGRDQD